MQYKLTMPSTNQYIDSIRGCASDLIQVHDDERLIGYMYAETINTKLIDLNSAFLEIDGYEATEWEHVLLVEDYLAGKIFNNTTLTMIHWVMVDQQYQRQGIAQEMLAALVKKRSPVFIFMIHVDWAASFADFDEETERRNMQFDEIQLTEALITLKPHESGLSSRQTSQILAKTLESQDYTDISRPEISHALGLNVDETYNFQFQMFVRE